jgi:aryl-alcohol dehydrogenase-like predicted oxidoreductase
MGELIKDKGEWERFQTAQSSYATIPHPHRIEEQKERLRETKAREQERRWHIIDAVRDVAEANGKSCAQVALNWLLAQNGIVGPVVGARTLEQLEDNLGAVGWRLTPEELDWLSEVSDPGNPYPLDFFKEYGIPWR